MIKNLKYAFRNLRRDKFYTFLNGLGLIVGMTVALLISMWVKDELSYDNYHSQNGSNYLILQNHSFGGTRMWGIRTQAPMAPAIKEQIPEVQHIARTCGLWKPVLKYENFLLDVKNTFLVDYDLFNILDFEFIQGDPETVFSDPNSIILTEANAKQLFGAANPIGRIVNLDEKLELEVTGVIKDVPANTHLPVDCLVPFGENVAKFYNENSMNWGASNFSTYVTLRSNTDIKKVEKQIAELVPRGEDAVESERSFFELHPVQDIYLGLSKVKYGFAKGDWPTIQLFGLIAFIILLIASINYVNLTTARASHRAKATGIKKIVGASRAHLIGQHLTEAFGLISICSIGALLLARFSLPYFEELSGKEFFANSIFSLDTFLMLGGIGLFTVLLSGIQPSLQLSSFKPVETLKGSQFKGVAGKEGLRKVLVTAQFVSSTALIICTMFMLRQMDFIQKTKLGYEKEHIFKFTHNNQKTDVLKTALSNEASIKDIAISDQSIVSITNSLSGLTWQGVEGEQDLQLFSIYTGSNFKDFFELEMADGRWFRKSSRLDSAAVVINETAAKAMQLENPVGKWIDFWGERVIIVGLAKDFHFQSLHSEIKPLIFLQRTDWFPTMYIKATAENTTKAIAAVETIFKQHAPNEVFKYEFLDETFSQLYTKESRAGKLFLLFALITIIISCLGIFGLATYSAEKRFKEISIRKVLGASVSSIVHLLSKDFLQLVIFALLIAVPIAWYFMNGWLSNFAFRINLDWWVFAFSGLVAIVIAFVTVGLQSFRAAITNPADNLKNE